MTERRWPKQTRHPAAADGERPGGADARPRREQLRAQYEEQIRQVRVQDLVLQSAVSILQLSARRIAKEDEKDLEQARIGIDAANAMIDHVPEEAQGELRQAVSELKMLFAQHSGGGGEAPSGDDSGGDAEDPPGREAEATAGLRRLGPLDARQLSPGRPSDVH